MKNLSFGVSMALFSIVFLTLPATAQKGMGEPTGVGRQAVKPPIEAMSGTIKDIKIGPCERTTGRSSEGVHLIVETPDAKTINLHLGPSSALGEELKQLAAGQKITFEAFRTERMPKDAYVAKSLKAGDKTFELRDDRLRPKWAGGGRGAGRGQRMGAGKQQGQGACYW